MASNPEPAPARASWRAFLRPIDRRYLMPDSTLPSHVASSMIRPRQGYRLWFTYDAAMNPAIAAQTVPDPVFVTKASIPSRRFIINSEGTASLVPRRNFAIFGIVWEVPDYGMALLDLKLGVPHG